MTTAPTKSIVAKKASAKAPLKTTVKTATKPTAKSKPKLPVVAAQSPKAKKIKMVRDSLNIPKLEYAVVETLKVRAAKLGNPAKKTELIRAGIKAIAAMSDTAFLKALKAVPSLKTGRPAGK